MDIRYPEKKVDEAWKQSVDEERRKLEAVAAARETKSSAKKSDAVEAHPPSSPENSAAPAGAAAAVTNKSFMGLLQMLAMQAYLGLGEMENPVSGGVEINLPQAKAFIDLLIALQEKTASNLSKEEADSLNTLVYELQMKYNERKAGLH